MPYDDLDNVLNPSSGVAATSAWGDQIRTNFENGSYVVARTVLGGAASSIASGTLPTLSNGWKLQVIVEAQHASTTGVTLQVRFNADAGANYNRLGAFYLNGAWTSGVGAGATSLILGTVGNESASRWSTIKADVFGYLAARHKTVQSTSLDPGNLGTTALSGVLTGVWASTAAITAVSVTAGSGNLVAGSSLTVIASNFV